MKKTILFLAFIFIGITTYSQDTSNIELTRAGFKSVTIDISNKTKSDIHSKIIQWVNNTYVSPEKVLIANTTDVIRIRSFSEDGFSIHQIGALYYDIYYIVDIGINDNSIIYNVEVTRVVDKNGGSTALHRTSGFFKKNGKVRKPYAKGVGQMESTFKRLLQGIIDNLNSAMTREEAIAKLKESKDLLDLGLINQEEYEVLKKEFSPIIMGN